MDTINWRPMECGDWRSQLQAASRERIVNTIANILKQHVMLSGHEMQYVFKKTAVEIEELIYVTATSQVDYLQKISLKKQKFEFRSQNPILTANSVNTSHPGCQVPQQVNSQGQPHPIHVPLYHPLPLHQLLPYIMNNNINSTEIQVGDSSIKSGDWRNHLPSDIRKNSVNSIICFLKRDIPFTGHEILQEVEKIAQRIEDKFFTAATSKSDYICKIVLKLLTMEKRPQNPVPDTMQSNSSADSVNPSDPGSQVIQLLSQMMHNIGSTETQAIGESSMESSDWRDQLQPDSRQWIVNKIIDTLKRHFPFSEHEMLQEVEKMAVSFEDKIYTAATSQSDYMRKIFLKVPNMETGSMHSTSGATSVNPSDPGSQVMKQVNSQGQPLPIPVPSNQSQQHLQQTMHHNIGIQAFGESSTGSGDWRSQLQAGSRQRIVNIILDTLKRRVPYSGHEGLQELETLSVIFEEKMFTVATSQSEYLRKISSKLLTMDPRLQNPMPYAMQANSGANAVNPLNPGSQVMQQVNSQGQPHPILSPSNHPQPRQQLLPNIMQNNMGSTVTQASGDSSTVSGDWKAQMPAGLRHRIVNKMMDILKRHLPFTGHEEIEKIAVNFEEKIYTAATSQSDYTRKLSLKMLTMEARPQNPMPDAMQTNSGANSVNPSDPGMKAVTKKQK